MTAIVTIVVQTIGVIIWLVQLGADVRQLRVEMTTNTARINSMDERGTRALDIIRSRQSDVLGANSSQDQRLNELAAKLQVMETANHKMQTQIDLINAAEKRVEDQQIRMIQALDNTYNLLNEHLRIDHGSGGGSRTVNPPLRLPPP